MLPDLPRGICFLLVTGWPFSRLKPKPISTPMEWLGKVLFGGYARPVRRKHLRALGLALLLATGLCLLFSVLLYALNVQGRI